MAGIFDAVLTYQFIKKLTTPFNQLPAYRYNLIDDKGNFLKARNKFTPQEKQVLGLFDIMVINLKKLLAKIPGGASRIGTIAATALLLRSKPIHEDSSYEEIENYIEENFNSIYNDMLHLYEDNGVVANAASSGDVAGIGQPPGSIKGEPGVSVKAQMKHQKKASATSEPILAYIRRAKAMSGQNEDIVQGSQNAIPLSTKKATTDRKSKEEIIQVQNKVVGESLNEDTTLQYHKQLNPKIWNSMNMLKDDVKGKLLQIADAWVAFAKIPPVLIYDIVITGGNVNYNYTPFSDIDLHIVMSRAAINPDRALVDEYLQDKKILWSLQHPDISIYGFPVELYAQDIDEQPHLNQGVYSITQNKWIARPQHLDIDFENDFHLQKKVQFYKDMIDKMLNDKVNDDSIDILKDKIKKMRGDSIAKEGEFAFGNLIFKELRNAGYLDKLNDYKKTSQDKILSLGRP
jgi:hypothetical protein